ncbi:MAG: hypothetical protein JO199_02070 [Candidatus Eremiobacteraeota bacterium]|nr:hypothetical protein [Candidatus Eremiobacteraeota bacterium]
MDVRLVQLLGSFIAARGQYSLARLEFALHYPNEAAPPIIDRLAEANERALREEWPALELQLEEALAFSKRLERSKRSAALSKDEAYRTLRGSVRELDQYARAIRWVLTVTETETPGE